MKAKRRTPVSVVLAAAVLCLVLISAHFASGMFARYTVKSGGDGKGSVASFSVSAQEPTENPVVIINNGTDDAGKAEYTVKIKNSGDTAVRYEACVTFTGEKATENAEMFDESDDKLTFTGDLAPSEEAEETITFDMSAYFETNDKYNTFSNDDMSGSSGEAPCDVAVTFTQID